MSARFVLKLILVLQNLKSLQLSQQPQLLKEKRVPEPLKLNTSSITRENQENEQPSPSINGDDEGETEEEHQVRDGHLAIAK